MFLHQYRQCYLSPDLNTDEPYLRKKSDGSPLSCSIIALLVKQFFPKEKFLIYTQRWFGFRQPCQMVLVKNLGQDPSTWKTLRFSTPRSSQWPWKCKSRFHLSGVFVSVDTNYPLLLRFSPVRDRSRGVKWIHNFNQCPLTVATFHLCFEFPMNSGLSLVQDQSVQCSNRLHLPKTAFCYNLSALLWRSSKHLKTSGQILLL